nr:MAG TPA: hypothetical protein [Caudoviricetes sp.]
MKKEPDNSDSFSIELLFNERRRAMIPRTHGKIHSFIIHLFQSSCKNICSLTAL